MALEGILLGDNTITEDYYTASAVNAGEVVNMDGRAGVVVADIAAGGTGKAYTNGRFSFPAVEFAMSRGGVAGWDANGTPYGGSTTGAATTKLAAIDFLLGTIIEDMARCGADAVSVDQKNRLAESRKKLGDSTILLGNIDPFNTMVEGKPEDVEEAVKTAIADGADGIWPGCDIWPKISRENMEALVAATRKYGSRL